MRTPGRYSPVDGTHNNTTAVPASLYRCYNCTTTLVQLGM